MGKLLMRFFLFCSGASPDVLKLCSSTERSKQAMVGVTILFTGLFAMVSCSYALCRVFLAEPYAVPVSLFLGFFWGLFVFNLDRFLVSTVKKEGDLAKDVKNISPRILLAIVIAIVIATPLKVKIFEDRLAYQIHEIRKRKSDADRKFYENRVSLESKESESARLEAELAAVHDKGMVGYENSDLAFQRQLYGVCVEETGRLEEDHRKKEEEEKRKLDKVRPAINQEVAKRKKVRGDKELAVEDLQDAHGQIDAFLRSATDTEPTLGEEAGATAQLIPVIPLDLQQERRSAEDRVSRLRAQERELSASIGRLSTERNGIRRRISDLAETLGAQRAECKGLRDELTRITEKIAAEHDQWKAEIESQLTSNSAEIDQARGEVEQGVGESEEVIAVSFRGNFLTQLEALGELVDQPMTMSWWIHWMISVLFILIETAPILVKLISPRTAYDSIADQLDTESGTAGVRLVIHQREQKEAQMLEERTERMRAADLRLYDEHQKRFLHFGDLMLENRNRFKDLSTKLSGEQSARRLAKLFGELFESVSAEALQGFAGQDKGSVMVEEEPRRPVQARADLGIITI